MTPLRAALLTALVAAGLALQGCVIAAAAPLAAAGFGIATVTRPKPQSAPPVVAGVEPDAPAMIAAVSGEVAPVTTGVPDNETRIPGFDYEPGATLYSTGEAPAPGGLARAVESGTDYAAFRSYSLNLAQANRTMRGAPSALLATPGSLDPARASCTTGAPAVWIDLDPGRDTFDPAAATRDGDPALAAALADLRTAGIAVVWTTRLGDNFAELVRMSLRDSGLDPAGSDRLVLMRDIGERKQTRRDSLADTHCILAMLGDERADFDELFLYLKDPTAAARLDRLVGAGWFLTGAQP